MKKAKSMKDGLLKKRVFSVIRSQWYNDTKINEYINCCIDLSLMTGSGMLECF